MSRLTMPAAAAALMCQDMAVAAARAEAEQRPGYYLPPIALAVGTILSLPLMPAEVPERPHPLWLGHRLVTLEMQRKAEEARRKAEAVRVRMDREHGGLAFAYEGS